MRKVTIYSVLIFVITTLTGCPRQEIEHSSFTFYNNSNSNVCIYLGVAPRSMGGSLYPDTLLMNSNATTGPILKDHFFGYDFNRLLSKDTMCLFILDEDTISKYSWDIIKSDYKILQRYDLRVDDIGLRQLNFKITYPPTEAMKDIHMYPPYKKQ